MRRCSNGSVRQARRRSSASCALAAQSVAPEDCEGAFICASAWLAAAALTDARLGGAEELSSLRAGDVTIEVRGGANSERAAALRRSARQLMAPYTEGGGFFFCAVKG